MIIAPLRGLSCKQRLARFSAELKTFKIDRVWQYGVRVGVGWEREVTTITFERNWQELSLQDGPSVAIISAASVLIV